MLRDVRDFSNPDPRPKANSPARRKVPPSDREPAPEWEYIGAFGQQENWLEEWTVFGPESTTTCGSRIARRTRGGGPPALVQLPRRKAAWARRCISCPGTRDEWTSDAIPTMGLVL